MLGRYDILRGKNQEFSLIFTKIFLGDPPPDPRTFLQSDFSYDILREKNQEFSYVTPYTR